MSEEIEFVLRGRLDGVPITPRSIGLSQFNEFNQQVEMFIAGRDKLKLNDVHVAVEEGSYLLRAFLPAVVVAAVGADLKLLERQDTLGEIDPRRAEIVQKWQARAKAHPEQFYEVRPKEEGLPQVRIGRETDYRVGDVIPWVTVEKYLFGRVLDMGGAQRANIHLRLQKGGEGAVGQCLPGLSARPGGKPALPQGAAACPRRAAFPHGRSAKHPADLIHGLSARLRRGSAGSLRGERRGRMGRCAGRGRLGA